MRNIMQLVGGVVVAGAVAAGSTAFTGAGLSFLGTGTGQSSIHVGGTIKQTVTGTQIDSVAYTNSTAGAFGGVTDIVVTYNAAVPVGKTVTVTPSGGTNAGTADHWTCTLNGGRTVSTCALEDTGPAPVGVGGAYVGMTTLTVAVS